MQQKQPAGARRARCITENPPYTALRPPIPCTALDPFLGSGRTALACEELGRDCIGIELNPASVQMATAQLERAKARRFIGDAERVPIPERAIAAFLSILLRTGA